MPDPSPQYALMKQWVKGHMTLCRFAASLLNTDSISLYEPDDPFDNVDIEEKRDIPLPAALADALNRHKEESTDFRVFPHHDGTYKNRDKVKRPLWRACHAAGLREIGWHDLRHTYASQLVMRDVSIKTVQELLGHKDIQTTLKYAHLSDDVKEKAVEVLNW